MSSGLPPVSREMGGFPSLPSRTLWAALEQRFPSGTGVLTLLWGRDPHSGAQTLWSPELSLWFPPHSDPPPSPSLLPLKAEALRQERGWTVRIRYREGSASPERMLEWNIPGPPAFAQPSRFPEPSLSWDRDSSISGIFRAPSDPAVASELFHGPFPTDPSLTMKPESCLLELRWPGLDPVSPERGGGEGDPGEEGVPFRLEIRFPGGETAIVGGVYESRTRFLSVSARLSSSALAGFWDRSLPEIARDLSEVFRIKMEGRSVDEGTRGG
ncbi:MAG: hypothetical protein ACYDAM_06780 [Leptospirales bacterium]